MSVLRRWPMRLFAWLASGLSLVLALGAAAAPSSPHALATRLPGFLTGVSARSPSDAWAVGSFFPAQFTQKTLILRWNGTSWARVVSANRGGSGDFNLLSGVSALSPSNAWAVGNTFFGAPDVQKTLIQRWNGNAWSLVPSPNPGPRGSQFDALNGVGALSPNNIWAVGTSTTGTLIVHWNGTRWANVPSPSPATPGDDELLAVSATSPRDAWAVGQYLSFSGAWKTLVLHWNGIKWTRVASPNPGGSMQGRFGDTGTFLFGVSALSPSSVWAAGYYLTSDSMPQKTLILRWNGSRWLKVASPNPGNTKDSSLTGVSVLSPSNAWAVGRYLTKSEASKTLVLHWNGTRWAVVASRSPAGGAALNAVSALSPRAAWAVGSFSGGGIQRTLILHWNGTSWTRS